MVQAEACEHAARGSIHADRSDARAHRVDGGELRLQHRTVHAFHFGAGRAHREHAGHVAGVAVLKRAHIDHHQVAGCQAGRAWAARGAARSGRRSPRWFRKLGFSAPRRRMRYSSSAARSLSLHAGLDARNGLLERAGVGLHAAPDERQFSRPTSSCAALRSSRSTGSSEAPIGRRDLIDSKDVAGHAGGLVPNPLDARLAERGQHVHHQRAFGDTDLAGGFLRGLDLVSRVGEQDASIGKDQQGAVAAGETAEITQVGAEGYQQAIEFALAKLGGNASAGAVRTGYFPLCNSLARIWARSARASAWRMSLCFSASFGEQRRSS